MTVLEDGSVTIDLDSKHVEVERMMPLNRLVIRHERDDVIDTHAKTLIENSSK
jgi:hypothetical protein